MATKTLAAWACNLTYASIPPSVVKAASRSFYNWYGCAIGGSDHEAVSITIKSLAPFFGRATSSIPGREERTDAQHAALINGIASHVHDYDDTHLDTIIHPTAPVASALLAYAETLDAVSSEDFLAALVAGIEAECKLGMAVWPNHYDIGWHITSTTGTIGAAVAVGRLLKLSPEAMGHAIGIASAQVTGLREHFGSHTKSFHPGRAAQNGLLSALLASNGFTASESALEGKRGWTHVVSTVEKVDELFASLGRTWETEKNAFKPFPCGIVIHPIIDACIQLGAELREHGQSAEAIRTVELQVHHLVLELTGKKTPRDGLEGKFSVYHGAAIGLVLGKATPAEYEDAVVLDPAIVAVRDRVVAEVKDIPPESCRAKVTMRDGAVFERHVRHAVGSLEKPMTEEQLEAKFLDQVGKVVGEERARRWSEAARGLEGAHDVVALLRV